MSDNQKEKDKQVVTLRRWQIALVVTQGNVRTRHVWGHDVESDGGRVSSAIVDFKPETMTLSTASGSQYRLAGLPGPSKKGKPVWDEWCKTNKVIAQKDVTNDYMDPDNVSTRQFAALNEASLSASESSESQ